MYTEFTGRYHVHESSRSFADVVAALEAAVDRSRTMHSSRRCRKLVIPRTSKNECIGMKAQADSCASTPSTMARGCRTWEAAPRRGCTRSAIR